MDGLLIIDKPEGLTSFDVVRKLRGVVRRLTGIKRPKVGHTGTLDPFATGVLPICVGRTTRLARYLIEGDKRYRATMRLGVTTTTDDVEGEPVSEPGDWQSLSEAKARQVLEGMIGPQMQRPPIHSAIKVDGRRAYELAREGMNPELAPRPITIHDLSVDQVALPDVTFTVTSSKGTYIRAICRDAGAALGVGGHCVGLRRLAAAGFEEREAQPLAPLLEGATLEQLQAGLHTPWEMLRCLRTVWVDEAAVVKIRQGQRVPIPESAGQLLEDLSPGEPLRVGTPDGVLVCVALREGDRLKPERVMA